jgi:hypothetical protein
MSKFKRRNSWRAGKTNGNSGNRPENTGAKGQGGILEVGRINEKGLDTKPKNRYKPLKFLKISVYLMTS